MFFFVGFSQSTLDVIKKTSYLLSQDSILKANTLITKETNKLIHQEQYDTLAVCIKPYVRAKLLKNKLVKLNEVVTHFNCIVENSKNLNTLYLYYSNIAKLYGNKAQEQQAFEYAKKAQEIALKLKNKQYIAEETYYLGEFSMQKGDYSAFFLYLNQAVNLLEQQKDSVFLIAPKAYNLKGGIMHLSAKPDSANYFFKKAISSTQKLEASLENNYYIPAGIYSNWFLSKQAVGNYEKAQEYIFKAINFRKAFLKKAKNHPLELKAYGNLSVSYRNATSLMHHLGAYDEAKRFSKLAYLNAKENLKPNNIRYFQAVLLMAETSINYNDYESAIRYLKEAEEVLSNIKGENLNWYSQLYAVFGNAYFYHKNYKKATKYYEKYQLYWEKSNGETYQHDDVFLLLNQAQAYAHLNQSQKANLITQKVCNYVEKNYGKTSFLANECSVNKLRISFILKQYEKTIQIAQKSIQIYENTKTDNLVDRYYFENNKPEVLFLKAQSEYELLKNPSEKELLPIAQTMQKAIDVLEEKKALISSIEEVNFLISEHTDLIDFAKKVHLKLYEFTKNDSYLNTLLELHESAIYNRIRARLNLREVALATIDTAFTNKERKLKQKLAKLNGVTANNDANVTQLLKTISEWNAFQDSLQKKYPNYYKKKYASVKKSIHKLKNFVSKNTTLLRYLFIQEQLYVVVINSTEKNIIALPYKFQKNDIQKLSNFKNDIKTITKISNRLYDALWNPVVDKINTEKLIIFPDKELFNLSFDMLSAKKATSFQEFFSSALINKHTISYNYSLLVLKNKKATEYTKNYVAFAPEFNTKMKNDYKLALSDSSFVDRTYLKLLPQPFSVDLITKFTKKFNGTSFLKTKASKQLFSEKVAEHKIIHIGTHAQVNNQNPDLSRLVFAKNLNDSTRINDNLLYAYEIYNQNLSTNLAILTACGTGRPTFQSGEGMISLAHAFNYAGSESILTSLWEIDEQSSTKILEWFYIFLQEGIPKDEALKKAKLKYLNTAVGRTSHPQYWAGLVLIGNTKPIILSNNDNWIMAVISFLGILLILTMFYRKRVLLTIKKVAQLKSNLR